MSFPGPIVTNSADGKPHMSHDETRATATDGPAAPDTENENFSLDAIYRGEGPRLAKYFRFHSWQRQDASDLVQETFLRFAGYAQRETLRNPVAMLHRIARNLLFEQTRRYKTRGAKETTLDSTAEIAVQPTQIREIEARQMMDAYQRAVDLLPPRTREVFLLHRVDSLSYKEIAAQLGIGLRTVEWHMTEALLRLRRMMDEQ